MERPNVEMKRVVLTEFSGEILDFAGPGGGPKESLSFRTDLRGDGTDLEGVFWEAMERTWRGSLCDL